MKEEGKTERVKHTEQLQPMLNRQRDEKGDKKSIGSIER